MPIEIDWGKATNEIIPNSHTTEQILIDYIELNNKKDCFNKLEYQDLSITSNRKSKSNAAALIVHSEILAKKSNEERAGEGLKLFRFICEQNGYCHEHELSQLERASHNNARRCIYSIINKVGKIQFLSFDYRHAMIELCNENGEHQGEYHFDGTINSKDAEEDHSLTCIEVWRKLKNKD